MALSYKNDNQEDQRLDPYNLKESEQNIGAHSGEQSNYDREFRDIEKNYDKSADSSQENRNIDALRNQESSDDNQFNYGPGKKKVSKSQPVSLRTKLKRRSPLMVILGLLGIGGFGLSFIAPAGALLQFTENLSNKLDTMSSVVDARGTLILRDRFFNTSATCKIKVQCKYKGFTTRQLERLNAQGAKIYAGDKEITKDSRKIAGRYRGGTRIVLADGTKVTADGYRKAMRSNAGLRTVSKNVFAPRWSSWNDKISRDIRQARKIAMKPDWGDDKDKDKATRQGTHRVVTGEAAEDVNISADRGSPTDADGNKNSELGVDAASDESKEIAEKERTAIEAGEKPPTQLADDLPGVANSEFAPSESAGKKAVNFLNPVGFLTGYCTAFQLSRALTTASRVVLAVQMERYAAQFLSTAGKLKAGDLQPSEMEKTMKVLQRTNEDGKNFGDSVAYQFATYGSVPSIGVGASMTGNGIVRTLTAATTGWANKYAGAVGGARGVSKLCKVATNPWVQGGLILTNFIPGGGAALKGITAGAEGSVRVVANNLIKSVTENVTKKLTDKTARKELRNKITTGLAGAGGIFLATYLVGKYAIPYFAKVIAGTMFTGDEDGVTAADTIGTGYGATHDEIAQTRGLAPLTKEQAVAFNKFKNGNTNQYIADSKNEANPLNPNDPYSTTASIAASLNPILSNFNLSNNGTFSPQTILSSLIPGSLSSSANAKYDDGTNGCTDDYAKKNDIATDPFCNAIYGFPDTDMLENTRPSTVADWMLDHGQIDKNGDEVSGSDFADFKETCIPSDGGKQVASADDLEDEKRLDEKCYKKGEKWDTTKESVKMYRLYIIDFGTDAAMDYTPANEGGSSSGKADFTVAAYNILRETDKKHSGAVCRANGLPNNQACFNKRIENLTNVITGKTELKNNKFDLVMINENTPKMFSALQRSLGAANYEGIQSKEYAIFWNKEKFTKTDSGTAPSNSGGGRVIQAPWVGLKAESGRKVFAMPLHYSSFGKFNGSPAQSKVGAQRTLNWIKSKAKDDTIVVTGGDAGYFANASGAVFNASGVVKNVGLMAQKKASSGSAKATGADQMYITPISGLSVSNYHRPNETKGSIVVKSSDHAPVYADVGVAGDESSSGATAGKGFVGPSGFTFGQCVAYVKAVLRKHFPKYDGGSTGNGRDVAANLAKKYKLKLDHTPAVHSVVSFHAPYGASSAAYGHVAIVSQVDVDGSGNVKGIWVEEANYARPLLYGKRYIKDKKIISKSFYAHTETGWKN